MQFLALNTEEHNGENEEREIWNSISQDSFQRVYDEDEPDYSDVKVLEHNPKYGM